MTEQTTTPPYDPSVISPHAEVVKQASEERPAEVELGLTNDGERSVPVSPESSGLPLEFLTLSDDSGHTVYFVPKVQQHVHIRGGELPESRTDGCWKLPDGSKFVVEDLDFDTVIEPGETYAKSHYIFEPSQTTSCFPTGKYSITSTLKLAGTMMEGPSVELRYTLTIDEQKQMSVSVE
ncbi:hypothetical protein [Haloferax sp. DFSO52]|uniref:hypothetical protein n=1 Tax=Haloferax sp. DFSO52 TaxID=3388505 RepID=UPI003A877862